MAVLMNGDAGEVNDTRDALLMNGRSQCSVHVVAGGVHG